MEKKLALIPAILLLIGAACSHPDSGRLMGSYPEKPADSQEEQIDTLVVVVDSTQVPADAIEYDKEIDRAENFYAQGVTYFQRGIQDSAQQSYEQALEIISEIDIDPDGYHDQALRLERLLKEIEQDYRLTLMATGVLYSESSVAAFREMFEDVKNFKKLKESNAFKSFDKSDTVIYDIPIEWNEKVENSLVYLQTVAREAFSTYLERSGRYFSIVEDILAQYDVPHDLAYLPLIESGYNPHAYSYARAVGMWQFISATGRLYGLHNSWWYDGRRDFEKSTHAAARHLKDLYDEFGSWNLALAAYNGGAGRIRREIRKHGTKDFWKLKPHKQTRNYVPLFMAATIIAKQPEKYGFHPNYQEPLVYDTVEVSKCISFKNISTKTGIKVSELELLNPELRRGVTPPDIKNYRLRLPKGTAETFASVYDNIPSEKATSWVKHTIRKGETVSQIAAKYGVSISSIMQANKLSRRARIYAGKTLMIPVPPGRFHTSQPRNSNTIKKSTSGKYVVRSGDTLWDIAQVHGMSVGELKRLNGLSSNRIYAGRELNVTSAPSAPSGSSAASSDSYDNYRVRRGDNLNKIASRFGTSVSHLRSINGLRSNTIYVGTYLKVPSNSSSGTQYSDSGTEGSAGQWQSYTIRRGDTLWDIAQKFGVSISDLARWNSIESKSRLMPGDKLKIYLR